MKKYLTLILLSSILFVGASPAQDFRFTLSIRNSDCKGANNGVAGVSVQQLHPPYSFLWSTGSTASAVNGLAPGAYSLTITDSLENDTMIAVNISENPCELGPDVVFTPNNDGINDTWAINNVEYYPDNLILVYNRWGQKVYERQGSYEPWEGRDLQGIPLPDDSYFFVIYPAKEDKKKILKGSVSILR
ncbi:MAG: large protein [Bacteroidota bacterium]|nr:large protein [Bacteroidota bacterium]